MSESSTYLDLMVSPLLLSLVTRLLNCSDIQYETLVPDLQKSIDEVRSRAFCSGSSRVSLAVAAAESNWQRQQQRVTGRGSRRESLEEAAAESHWERKQQRVHWQRPAADSDWQWQQQRVFGRGSSRESLAEAAAESHWQRQQQRVVSVVSKRQQ